MSAQSGEPVRIGDADIDELVEHMRRAGRPFSLDELTQVLLEIWRRRRAGR